MVQQAFDFLFVVTLFVPAVAVIIGLLSLAVPVRRNDLGHEVRTPVRA